MSAPSSATPPAKHARPLSPHLQVYKPQLTSGLSIFHRVTGAGLSVGMLVFVAWLAALAQGPKAYDMFLACAHSVVGQVLLFGWTFAFFYHFGCGIRHLLWNAGLCLDIKNVYRTGYILVAAVVVIVGGLWLKILGILP